MWSHPVTLRLRNEEQLLASVSGDRERFYSEVLQPFKLEGYARYLRSRSAWSDVKVILETLLAVVAPGDNQVTTPEELKTVGPGA